MKLPKVLRPEGRYRKLQLGLDVPSTFYEDIKAIDKDLHLVWHPHRVLWDDIINGYEGPLDCPRYTINSDYTELSFGFVLTDTEGMPIPDNKWHIWRLCWPHGWAHVFDLASLEGNYLNLLARRLHLQARFSDKYGHVNWNIHLREEQDERIAQKQKDEEELFSAWEYENEWLIKKAHENFARGIKAPTNPTKDSIISYPGQSNRSRLVTPLDDAAGGIVGPDGKPYGS